MAHLAERNHVTGAELRQVLHDFIARRVADPETADDLTQDVLLKAHRSGMDPGGGFAIPMPNGDRQHTVGIDGSAAGRSARQSRSPAGAAPEARLV